MIAFAFVDENGIPIGGGIRRELPEGAIPLDRRFTTTDLPRLRWRDGAWEERSDPPSLAAIYGDRETRELDVARAQATARIKERVGEFRARWFTDIPGQDALYLEKRAEAVAYVREAEMTGEPATLDDYPLLAGEVGITADTAWQLAQLWLDRADRFRAYAAATESARMRAAAAISAARDHAELQQIEVEYVIILATLKP